ncbi:MAG: glycosyl hydrolase 53 family protein [Clostridiales bacterium]|nr:glycosyl hydrolase 53 family protein [Clostridiales bacterium]
MKSWIKGADLSSLLEVEACGGVFSDHGVQGDAMEILAGYGFNLVRLRLWNDPYSPQGEPYGAGNCDLACVMTLARRAKALGMDWLLDLHYSDFWADPGKQITPKAWQGLGMDALEQAVYDYTFSVMTILREANLLPSIVAVGNELSCGLLWPLGRIPAFDNIARLVSAGIRAVRRTSPGVSVMLHLDNGGCNDLYRTWFDSYFAAGGADFEYIGLSYYPFWHGSPNELRANLNDLALRYHKDMVVAEVSMGHTTEDYQRYEKLPEGQRKGMATKPELVAKVTYPMTPQGQSDFMQEIMEILRDVPENRGKGFIYWEPAWLPVPGSGWATQPALDYTGEAGPGGNEWANQALFNYDGEALPALETIRAFSPISN